jgi:hypothetical protein
MDVFFKPIKKYLALFLKKKKLTLYGLILLFLFLLFAGLFRYSESPSFCGLCHNMKQYIESWKASSHREVSCLSCHRTPGILNHLKGKWTDFQLAINYFTVGKGFRKLHYEVDDGNCLQKGCHQIETLSGEMIFKNVHFPHGKHLGELRRGMRLRCTSCHAQLVQGLHLTVHETNCFICHFYRVGPRGEEECISCAVGGCKACHIEPKGDINIKGWNFNHRKYIERGVECEHCHMNVVQGDGHVPEGKCLQCHSKLFPPAVKYHSLLMHRTHVTDHKIECSECHTPIRHEIGPILTMVHSPVLCDRCHTKEMHLVSRDFYRGVGGVGVPESPSLMFLANIECFACHRKGEESRMALYTTKFVERAIGETCVSCHGEGYDETLNQWQLLLSKAMKETSLRISNAERLLSKLEESQVKSSELKKAENLLNEARHNYNYVHLGKGAHNIEFAFKLLNAANSKVEQIMALLDKHYQPKEFKSQMSCTTLCHIGMEKRTVPFNEIKFSHQTHVERKGLGCSQCHSPRENHGKTYFKNCKECHHRKEKKVKCEECHLSVKWLFHGKGGIGVQERPSPKLGRVECMDCHRGVNEKRKERIEEINKRCLECHDQSYADRIHEWKTAIDELLKRVEPKIEKAKEGIHRVELRRGHTFIYRKPFGEAEFNYNLVKRGGGIHNIEYSKEVLKFADHRLDETLKQLTKKR